MENEIDKYLNIKTTGRDDSSSNYLNFPYEATSYDVLQELSNSGFIAKNDIIIDYGCGKGRVDFFLAKYNKCRMIGLEYNKRLYDCALLNKESSVSGSKVSLVLIDASEYIVPDYTTGAYFFNPFSHTILEEVIKHIKASISNNKRPFKLFFYYPSKEYHEVLKKYNIRLINIIELDYIFLNGDNREKIEIYEL